jgi:hypothetical protein
MAKLGISTGTTSNDGTGDTLSQGAIKINSNFNEIYTIFGNGSSLKNNWNYTSVGIHTISNVGVGTTNPTSILTVRGGDVSVGVSTAHGVVLTSPNGTQFRLIINDSGVISTVMVS